MTRQPQTIAFWWGRLPHWEVGGGRYFITIHLAGAIPIEGQRRLRALTETFKRAEGRDDPRHLQLQRLIFREMEEWLDRAVPNAHLQRSDIAAMVVEAIEHRHNCEKWSMFEYVIMPTHLHLFCELGAYGLKETMEDFKRWTGHGAAKLLGVPCDRFWQREWFDHWSRSPEEDERIMDYIRNNPVKARLVSDHRQWPYGSWNKGIVRQ